MAIATGQFTIIDFNDAVSLTAYINSSLNKTIQYSADGNGGQGSYSPDWTSTNCTLTPSIFKMGSGTDMINDAQCVAVTWYEINTSGQEVAISAGTNYGISGKTLSLKSSAIIAGLPSKDIICKIQWHDSKYPAGSQYDVYIKAQITFTRVVNGGGLVACYVTAPLGNVFKNATSTSTLKVHGDLWRGSVVDTSSVTYTWFQQDSSVLTEQMVGAGAGWRKITADTANTLTGWNTNEITIYPSAVSSYTAFKLGITDNDSASPTTGTTFWDTISIADQSDPFQVGITSTNGDVFKDGNGDTVLISKLYQAGLEVDPLPAGITISKTAPASPVANQYWLDCNSGTLKQYISGAWSTTTGYTPKYTYTWSNWKSDGTKDTSWGSSGSKTGKYIYVDGTQVDTKGTFIVDVS